MSSLLPAALGGSPAFMEPVPFVRPTLPKVETIEPAVREMFATGHVTKGLHLDAFESAVAKHLGVRHAIAVSSCTTGLMLAYRGMHLEGDVVVPSFTFMATVSALVWAGLRPVFADVNPATATLDVAAVERAITPRTSAIVAVHTFGNPAAIEALQALAARRGLKLAFDAAHGFGSLYDGRPVGSQGDVQVFSLSPTKLLIAGEGGIVATNDDELARRVRWGREYGNDGTYDSVLAGINARMPEFNALLGLHSLDLLEEAAQRRNVLAALYREALADVVGIRFLDVREKDRCSFKDLSICIDADEFGVDRDCLARALTAEGIDTRKYYAPPVHEHTAYRRYAPAVGSLPNTQTLASQSLSLPMFSQLSGDDVLRIADAIRRIRASGRKIIFREASAGCESSRRVAPLERQPA